VREAAAKTQCGNNLHQIGIAAHNYYGVWKVFPPGRLSPSNVSPIVHLLPYFEQANKFAQFDFTQDINSGANNAAARLQDLSILLCPSDPSGSIESGKGRSNYHASLGAHAWYANTNATTGGIFFVNSKVRIPGVMDGTSNTAMFAEIKRGWRPSITAQHPTNVTNVPFGTWDAALPTNDLNYFADCNTPTKSDFDYTGLQYFRAGVTWTAFYTHTVPPNHQNRDCVRGTGLNKGHQAARSYHTGGVNALLCDGSVRFVGDGISLETWRAVGTRGGQEVLGGDWE
jgi:prepilin-type processing-associated H-X9-DG protein